MHMHEVNGSLDFLAYLVSVEVKWFAETKWTDLLEKLIWQLPTTTE